MIYIHQQPEWPDFFWDQDIITARLGKVRYLQGKILGKMESLGFKLQEEAILENMTLDVVKTSEIEGETLDLDQVRSSVARQLGIDIPGLVHSDRHVDG